MKWNEKNDIYPTRFRPIKIWNVQSSPGWLPSASLSPSFIQIIFKFPFRLFSESCENLELHSNLLLIHLLNYLEVGNHFIRRNWRFEWDLGTLDLIWILIWFGDGETPWESGTDWRHSAGRRMAMEGIGASRSLIIHVSSKLKNELWNSNWGLHLRVIAGWMRR